VPVVFRWPKTGEVWTIRKDSGIWRLDSLAENRKVLENAISLADLGEGETRILGDTVYVGDEEVATQTYVDSQVIDAADANKVHTEPVPVTTWSFSHNLAKRCAITTVNLSGRVIEGDVVYGSDDLVTITFNPPAAGYAYAN
jgi:hypothetical protein